MQHRLVSGGLVSGDAGWVSEVLPGPSFLWMGHNALSLLVYHLAAQNAGLEIDLFPALIDLFSLSFFSLNYSIVSPKDRTGPLLYCMEHY